MNLNRKAPGTEKFTCFEIVDRRFDIVKNEITTSLSLYEESFDFKNDISCKKPLTKILKNFSRRFYPNQALSIDTYESFKYLFLISEVNYFYVTLCLKLDLNNNPTLNIYQAFNSGKPFIFEEEKPIFKAFNYEYGYFFNPYELKFEVREAENLKLPEDLEKLCVPLITKVKSLVN